MKIRLTSLNTAPLCYPQTYDEIGNLVSVTVFLSYIKSDSGKHKCKKTQMDGQALRLLMDAILQQDEIEILSFKPFFQITNPTPAP